MKRAAGRRVADSAQQDARVVEHASHHRQRVAERDPLPSSANDCTRNQSQRSTLLWSGGWSTSAAELQRSARSAWPPIRPGRAEASGGLDALVATARHPVGSNEDARVSRPGSVPGRLAGDCGDPGGAGGAGGAESAYGRAEVARRRSWRLSELPLLGESFDRAQYISGIGPLVIPCWMVPVAGSDSIGWAGPINRVPTALTSLASIASGPVGATVEVTPIDGWSASGRPTVEGMATSP